MFKEMAIEMAKLEKNLHPKRMVKVVRQIKTKPVDAGKGFSLYLIVSIPKSAG